MVFWGADTASRSVKGLGRREEDSERKEEDLTYSQSFYFKVQDFSQEPRRLWCCTLILILFKIY